mmetsp:Transcript_20028/g.43584  ORF Transcript_20028/g.43584 Transcript_20028/m.43584 type:complete len:236 (+) Transcript_20028:245-952(+)
MGRLPCARRKGRGARSGSTLPVLAARNLGRRAHSRADSMQRRRRDPGQLALLHGRLPAARGLRDGQRRPQAGLRALGAGAAGRRPDSVDPVSLPARCGVFLGLHDQRQRLRGLFASPQRLRISPGRDAGGPALPSGDDLGRACWSPSKCCQVESQSRELWAHELHPHRTKLRCFAAPANTDFHCQLKRWISELRLARQLGSRAPAAAPWQRCCGCGCRCCCCRRFCSQPAWRPLC